MIGINRLQLVNFRNYERREFAFDAPVTVLCGSNGIGKSNVLEAISYLALLRSFRGANRQEMARLGGDGSFLIKAELTNRDFSETLAVKESVAGRNDARILYIGSNPVKRTSEFINEFRMVCFSPEDRELVVGPAGKRRRFFDMLISILNNDYFIALANYKRALEQRNRALKMQSGVAFSFDDELAVNAAVILRERKVYARLLAQEVNTLLGGNLRFEIRANVVTGEDMVDEIRARLVACREHDLREQVTGWGPHRDEFELRLDNHPLRGYGSTGQCRLISLLMKLSEFRLLKRNTGAQPVVALVDDVTGELDEANRLLFYENIAVADQVICTLVEPPDDNFFAGCQMIALP